MHKFKERLDMNKNRDKTTLDQLRPYKSQPSKCTHLTTHLGSNELFLPQYHPGREQQHDGGMACITKHDSKQEWEGGGRVQGCGKEVN